MNPADTILLVTLAALLLGCLAVALGAGWRRWTRHREVERRVRAMVRRVLSDQEYASLRQQGFFEIPSRLRPGRTYRVPTGGSPVAVLEPDGRVVYLCLQPSDAIPRREQVVIHKLLLEGAEAEYWQQANRVGRAMGRGFGRHLLG